MIFTHGERATPAKRVLTIIQEGEGLSPYEVYRQTQLVASTRDAEWYCRELGRLGLAFPSQQGRACWYAVALNADEVSERLRLVRPPHHKNEDAEETDLLEQDSQ